MLSGLRWLALEAKYLDRAREFYETYLDLSVVRESDDEVVFAAGDTKLVLREPGAVPRGGVHTHYAFATPRVRYETWHDRLADALPSEARSSRSGPNTDGDPDLVEFDFGGAKSLYFYDPDGNCVEIGSRGGGDADITSVFEIVLEVESLARAEAFYESLGFEAVDRGEERRRVRLGGPVDLELWEPQLGLADARGGLHADVGFSADDPETASEAVADRACSVEELSTGMRVRDPDGHYLTFR